MIHKALFWIASMSLTILVLCALIEATDDGDAPKSKAPASQQRAPSQPDLPTFKVQ